MKRQWEKEYKWELTKVESAFDKKLKENGFNILGVRMYISKTEYKIEKDGVEVEFAILREAKNIGLTWKVFVECYEIKKEYDSLKREYDNKRGVAN